MPSITVEDDTYLRVSLAIAESMLSMKQKLALQKAVQATMETMKDKEEE